MRIKYNAPVTLSFAIISAIVLALNSTIMPGITESWFAVGPRGSFHFDSLHSWVTLFSYSIGHANLEHYLSNFSFILLLGPILEANYGSASLLLMMCITTLTGGVLNVLFFSTGLLGASGLVFMMILLASFTNINKGEIPLTFILILVLYLGGEILSSFKNDDISQFAHIAGGICGSLFGFFHHSQNTGITNTNNPGFLDEII
ncbi:MAG: rhomboid family intramembrane serine protease [Spirochaetaceae bacterium]|jgi:membrane associated rhomboid family serine protease|nr:rhomboid family intramembrane serine protease [Spirochaetaceae bacterium]